MKGRFAVQCSSRLGILVAREKEGSSPFSNPRLTAGLMGATIGASIALLGVTPAIAAPAVADETQPLATEAVSSSEAGDPTGAQPATEAATPAADENAVSDQDTPDAQDAATGASTTAPLTSQTAGAQALTNATAAGSVIYNGGKDALTTKDSVSQGLWISATDTPTGHAMDSGSNTTSAILDATKTDGSLDAHVALENHEDRPVKVGEILCLPNFQLSGADRANGHHIQVVLDGQRVEERPVTLGLTDETVTFSITPGEYLPLDALKAKYPDFSWEQVVALMAQGWVPAGTRLDASVPLRVANLEAMNHDLDDIAAGKAPANDSPANRAFTVSTLHWRWNDEGAFAYDSSMSSSVTMHLEKPLTALMEHIRQVTQGHARWDATIMHTDEAGLRVYEPAPDAVQAALQPLSYSDFVFKNFGVAGDTLYGDGSYDIKLEGAFDSVKDLGYTVNILPDGTGIWPYCSYNTANGPITSVRPGADPAKPSIYLQVSRVFDTKDLVMDAPGSWSASKNLTGASVERYRRDTMALASTENLMETGNYSYAVFDKNGAAVAQGTGNGTIDHLGPGAYVVRYTYQIDPSHKVTKTAHIEVKALTFDASQPSDTVYNGQEQHMDLVATDASGRTLRPGVDYTLTYSPAVDAGSVTVTATGLGDYTGCTVQRTYLIAPAPLEVVTDGASKPYDGTPLTAGGTLSGLVDGETATLNTTGSQTEVGSSPNTYELVWDGTAKEGNYRVATEHLGTLTVEKAKATEPDGPADPGRNDGTGADTEKDGATPQNDGSTAPKVAGTQTSATSRHAGSRPGAATVPPLGDEGAQPLTFAGAAAALASLGAVLLAPWKQAKTAR